MQAQVSAFFFFFNINKSMWVVLETTLKKITALLLGVVGETWVWVLQIDLLVFNYLFARSCLFSCISAP